MIKINDFNALDREYIQKMNTPEMQELAQKVASKKLYKKYWPLYNNTK